MLRNLIVLFMANFLLGYWYSPPRPRSLAASRYSVSGQQSASQVSDILSVSFRYLFNDFLLTVLDKQALLRRLAVQFATREVVPSSFLVVGHDRSDTRT